eukprot:6898367-Karenia_brevis.AAC.1
MNKSLTLAQFLTKHDLPQNVADELAVQPLESLQYNNRQIISTTRASRISMGSTTMAGSSSKKSKNWPKW